MPADGHAQQDQDGFLTHSHELSEVLAGIDERYGAEDRIGTFLANVPDAPDIQATVKSLTKKR